MLAFMLSSPDLQLRNLVLDFAEKRVAITGGASGLGLALAQCYGRAGWRVAIGDIHTERLAESAETIRQTGAEVITALCDVRSDEEVQAFADQCQAQWGGVDVIINNAGVSSGGTVADTSMDDWHWTLDIDLYGVVRGCRSFVPLLREQGQGYVINIASFAGIANIPDVAAYNVAKAGVISLSESLRAEELDNGIGVSVVCPSFFQTNLMETFRSNVPGQKAWVENVMRKMPLTADDVAERIMQAMQNDEFLVLPHPIARKQYHIKRLAPEVYFKMLMKQIRQAKAKIQQRGAK